MDSKEFTSKVRSYLVAALKTELDGLVFPKDCIKEYDLGSQGVAYEIFFDDGSSAYIGPTPVTYKPKSDF